MRYKDLKPGQHFIVATEGMRGHFACEMWMNDEQPNRLFPEPWASDFMTYDTAEKAECRAKEMAAEQDLPYID